MKKIEKGNLIAIIISIIIGITIVLAVNLNSTAVKIAFTHTEPTQDEYNLLKEYALQVARNEYSDEDKDDDVKIEKIIEEENLKIKIQTSRMYGIEARFPISIVKDLEIENGTVNYEAEIDYDNDTYLEYTLIKTKSEIIVRGIIFAFLAAICAYTLIYWGPKEFKKANEKIAK